MKLAILFLFSIFWTVSGFSSTSIESPTISGSWTLDGSPYIIQNDVTIMDGESLTVEPGVEILFNGQYHR